MKRLTFCIALFFGLGPVPSESAPYSENLMSCHAHVSWLGTRMSHPERRTALLTYAEALRTTAATQAQAEGREDVSSYLADVETRKAAEWAGHGALWVFSQEMRDWGDYCYAFAEHLGLDPKGYLEAAFTSE